MAASHAEELTVSHKDFWAWYWAEVRLNMISRLGYFSEGSGPMAFRIEAHLMIYE
jgi:hypothetical protein